jgi:hypothetical protein
VQHSYFEVEEDELVVAAPQSQAGQFSVSGIVFEGCAVVPELVPQGSAAVADVAFGGKEGLVRVRYPLSPGDREALQSVLQGAATRAVLLDMSACDAIEGQFNTLAKYHAQLVAEAQAQRGGGAAELWLLPLHSRVRADGDYAATRKYWNELNETVRKNVAFVMTCSLEENPLVTVEHVAVLQKFFGDKRQLMLLDSVKSPFAVYSGRAANLPLKGLLVAFRGEHPRALSVSLRSALAFQAGPRTYVQKPHCSILTCLRYVCCFSLLLLL